MTEIQIFTPFETIAELVGAYADRASESGLVLPCSQTSERGTPAHFVVQLADGSVVLEGQGVVAHVLARGPYEFEISIEALEMDPRSEVMFERLVVARDSSVQLDTSSVDTATDGHVGPVTLQNRPPLPSEPPVEVTSSMTPPAPEAPSPDTTQPVAPPPLPSARAAATTAGLPPPLPARNSPVPSPPARPPLPSRTASAQQVAAAPAPPLAGRTASSQQVIAAPPPLPTRTASAQQVVAAPPPTGPTKPAIPLPPSRAASEPPPPPKPAAASTSSLPPPRSAGPPRPAAPPRPAGTVGKRVAPAPRPGAGPQSAVFSDQLTQTHDLRHLASASGALDTKDLAIGTAQDSVESDTAPAVDVSELPPSDTRPISAPPPAELTELTALPISGEPTTETTLPDFEESTDAGPGKEA